MKSKSGWIPSVLIGVLLIVGGGIGLMLAASHTALLPGTPVAVPLPELTLTTMDGTVVKVGSPDVRGKPLLINFWATWCPPCQEEMPALERVERTWRERGGMVLAVNFEEDGEAIRQYLAENGLSLPVFQDTAGEIASELDITYLPTTLFVDSEGIIRSRIEGPLSQGQMEAGLRAVQGKQALSGKGNQ